MNLIARARWTGSPAPNGARANRWRASGGSSSTSHHVCMLAVHTMRSGPAETLTAYAGLLHAFYLHWAVGRPIRVAGRERLRARLAAPAVPASPAPGVSYVQLPERLVWAAPAPDAAHEPLDGMFVVAAPDRVRVLAVLGFRPGREGFTTMEAVSPLPPVSPTARDDGAAPFATVLPAGERMGFFSVTSESELVALALLAHAEAAG